MAINFPNSPAINDEYVYNNKVYIWVGTKWLDRGEIGYTGSQGIQGTQGIQGIQGIRGYVGSAGIINWLTQTSNYTASAFDYILADTSAGTFTVTLPATPVIGDTVIILDKYNWTTNNLIIGRNGKTIENYADDFLLDVGQCRVEFVYDGFTWQIYSSLGPRGYTGSAGGLTDATAAAYAITLG